MIPGAYSMAITNVARYIRSPRNLNCLDEVPLNSFQASEVLAIAFCKSKEEVLADILHVEPPREG